jgi:hypothetical protein
VGINGEELAIADDVLRNTCALRGQSGQFFREAKATVNGFTSKGDAIYPPFFPSYEDNTSHTISTIPSGDDGQITPSEAVAAFLLYTECSALTQIWHTGERIDDNVFKLVGLPVGGTDFMETIDGMARFGNLLGSAAWVRDQIRVGESKPTGDNLGDEMKRRKWEAYEKPLEQDKMVIGKMTTQAIVNNVDKEAKKKKQFDRQFQKDKQKETPRQNSKTHGAQMARNLFLEASQLALEQLLK